MSDGAPSRPAVVRRLRGVRAGDIIAACPRRGAIVSVSDGVHTFQTGTRVPGLWSARALADHAELVVRVEVAVDDGVDPGLDVAAYRPMPEDGPALEARIMGPAAPGELPPVQWTLRTDGRLRPTPRMMAEAYERALRDFGVAELTRARCCGAFLGDLFRRIELAAEPVIQSGPLRCACCGETTSAEGFVAAGGAILRAECARRLGYDVTMAEP